MLTTKLRICSTTWQVKFSSTMFRSMCCVTFYCNLNYPAHIMMLTSIPNKCHQSFYNLARCFRIFPIFLQHEKRHGDGNHSKCAKTRHSVINQQACSFVARFCLLLNNWSSSAHYSVLELLPRALEVNKTRRKWKFRRTLRLNDFRYGVQGSI